MDQPRHKLFRAIVVVGAALTGCDDSTRCHHCSPPAPDAMADAKPVTTDAQITDGEPSDVILIL